ncbi:hypothetical protein [Ensifer sp. ENS03]|nr:hypothetical protein [Ensifer sp. ENS03]MBD9561035.1 hypothetical protein [Ensifer sp. ENS03]
MSYGAALPAPLMLSNDILTSTITYSDGCANIRKVMGWALRLTGKKSTAWQMAKAVYVSTASISNLPTGIL